MWTGCSRISRVGKKFCAARITAIAASLPIWSQLGATAVERHVGGELELQRDRKVTAVATFLLLAVGNMISTALLCGVGFCPENPGGYLIFNDNLRVTMFAGAL